MIPAQCRDIINAKKSQPIDPGIGRFQGNQCVKIMFSSPTASDCGHSEDIAEPKALPLAGSPSSLECGETRLAALNAAAHQGMLQAVNKLSN